MDEGECTQKPDKAHKTDQVHNTVWVFKEQKGDLDGADSADDGGTGHRKVFG